MAELGLKEDQVPLYEEVLELFPKKKYFVNLAGLYNELERPVDYTALLKTAYTKQLLDKNCLLYTSPSPRDRTRSRMPSSA